METQNLALAQLRPYWRNPRKNDAAVAAVKASIERYGYLQPIVVDESMTIIAGHTRYRALLELGVTDATVVIAKGLTPGQAKEYRIADNKSGELAEWDMSALVPELREIAKPADLQIFFGNQDIQAMLEKVSGGVDFKAPTNESIDLMNRNMNTRFGDASDKVQEDYVEVTCPHCGEGYFLSEAELKRTADTKRKMAAT